MTLKQLRDLIPKPEPPKERDWDGLKKDEFVSKAILKELSRQGKEE